MRTSRSSTPIIAAVLLLLPMLYVGSYFGLVVPKGIHYQREIVSNVPPPRYRWGGKLAKRAFWPLEQIDRCWRPGAWKVESYFDEDWDES